MDKRGKPRDGSRRQKRKSHVQEQLSRQQAEQERKRLEENRGKLQRSDFLCNYEFRHQLPPIPCGPKLMRYPFQHDRLWRYRITSLERQYEYHIHDEPDSAVAVDLVDIDRYTHTGARPDDADGDEKMLRAASEQGRRKRPQRAMESREGERMQTWMMDPVHEAASTAKRRRRTSKSPSTAAARSARAKELALLSAESLKNRIEHTFEVAKEVPVHAKKPDMKAVRVWSLVPDTALAKTPYVAVNMESHPISGASRAETSKTPEMQRLAEAARVYMSACLIRAREGDDATDLRAGIFTHTQAAKAQSAVETAARLAPSEPAGQEEVEGLAPDHYALRVEQALQRAESVPDNQFALHWSNDEDRVRFVPVDREILLRSAVYAEAESRVGQPLQVRRRPLERGEVADRRERAGRFEALGFVPSSTQPADSGAAQATTADEEELQELERDVNEEMAGAGMGGEMPRSPEAAGAASAATE